MHNLDVLKGWKEGQELINKPTPNVEISFDSEEEEKEEEKKEEKKEEQQSESSESSQESSDTESESESESMDSKDAADEYANARNIPHADVKLDYNLNNGPDGGGNTTMAQKRVD
mmetsp:Transcript_15077/g.13233  ORF Transcript_15077/g.13233 Transcript_15077/m.13233 type:complete len:115 (+) Transcript_15077:209-553(+)